MVKALEGRFWIVKGFCTVGIEKPTVGNSSFQNPEGESCCRSSGFNIHQIGPIFWQNTSFLLEKLIFPN